MAVAREARPQPSGCARGWAGRLTSQGVRESGGRRSDGTKPESKAGFVAGQTTRSGRSSAGPTGAEIHIQRWIRRRLANGARQLADATEVEDIAYSSRLCPVHAS